MNGFATRILQRSVGRTSFTVSDFLFLGAAAAVAPVFFVFGLATFRLLDLAEPERPDLTMGADDVEVVVISLVYFAIALAASLVAVGGVVLWLHEWLKSRRTEPALRDSRPPTWERASMPEQAVTVQLTGDEALVLFDWIGRFNENGDGAFRDQAEQRVLWDIEARLEKALVAPFAASYGELLAQARDRVRDSED
jgi:prepilin signal peptidase PulO-like enzyme (type II secretory pathway)